MYFRYPGLSYLSLSVSFIFRLLTEDPNERLGAKGAAEVLFVLRMCVHAHTSFLEFCSKAALVVRLPGIAKCRIPGDLMLLVHLSVVLSN